MKLKTAGLLRSLVRSGKRMTKLLAAATAPPKPKTTRKRKPVAASAGPRPAVRRAAAASAASAAPTATPSAAAVRIPPSPGKWLASHLTAYGHRMSYWLYIPKNIPEAAQRQGLPLLVMLHGCRQTATQFAQGTRMNHWAEEMGYAVLYPQQLVSTHAQRCWKWYDRATQEGGGDVPMIVGIVNKVMSDYAIDRSRIYIAGLSAGAGMANIVALNHPRMFAAVGMHSGPVFGAGHNTLGALGVMQHGAGMRADLAAREVLLRQPQFPGMPAILIQGEGDSVVRPINQVQLARQSLLLNGLADAAKITDKPQGRGGSRNAHRLHDFYAGRKLLLRVARIEQLEHAWSGGDPTLAYNAKAGPDASQMMLDFFSRHQRS